ncbi:MAG: hypothetical protein U1E86_02015 [Burkholderiaceae bacterium]
MKSIAKVLAPAALALASLSAHAGVFEIDSGLPPLAAHPAASKPAAVEPQLIQSSQGAVADNPALPRAVSTRTREEVRREAIEQRKATLENYNYS